MTARIAVFEPFAGASGDMILAALADAGVNLADVCEELARLDVDNWRIESFTVEEHGLRATRVRVTVDPSVRLAHWDDVERVITHSPLDPAIKGESLRIFSRLFAAEAHVHNMTRDRVHLHEMGNIDTLLDIVGAVIGLQMLGVTAVYVGAFPAGRGVIRTQHGLIPVPGPAVMELLRGAPMRHVDVEAELVTPTGAAILTTLAAGYERFPALTVTRTGYGAGTRKLPFANVLRLTLGEAAVGSLSVERVALLETQIDDMPPEWYGHVSQRLFDAGAFDVYLTPVQMKKGRPGTLLAIVCHPQHVEALSRIVLTETTTLGVRRQEMDRLCLPREVIAVATRFGPIAAKVATLPDGTRRASPEYEACRAVALARDVPLWEVYLAVHAAAAGATSAE